MTPADTTDRSAATDRPTRRRPRARLVAAATALVAGAAVLTVGVQGGSPADTAAAATSARTTGNPLAGRTWGVYKGPQDQAWAPYAASSGTERALLGKIALRPKAKWFGAWIANSRISSTVDKYIANATGGNTNTLVQMTVFRMKPWEGDACKRLPTAAEQSSYKDWVNRFAAAVGKQHAAIILQPDGPFALCVPNGSKVPSRLIAYSAQKFSALPNTTVYIDGGTWDWPYKAPAKSASFLVDAGVKYTRGFALNSTHYGRTQDDIDFGTQVVAELAKRGAPGKHFVINTSSNGQGFEFNKARGGNRDNAKVCETKSERVCVTLGIPPTTDVANTRYGFTATQRARALKYVDAYLWFGRPWLYMQADPFVKSRALSLARTTPW